MKKQQKDSKKPPANRKEERRSAYLKVLTVAVFGVAKVGKSSIIRRFCEPEDFSEHYEPTVEDFFSKHFLYNDRTYQLDIIDTCGSENFPAMRRVDIAKADAIILVYSMDNKMSFEQLSMYRQEIIEERGFDIPVVVVANKSDLAIDSSSLEITDKNGCILNTRDVVLKRWRYMWALTSAKMNWAIHEPFHMILDEIQRRKREVDNNNDSPKMKRKTSWLNRNFGNALSLRRTKSAQSKLNE